MKLFKFDKVYAHCDIPCGIYDPSPSRIAAETIVKMVTLIDGIKDEYRNSPSDVNVLNSITRYILVKEEHARICKNEILILWTDYFKEEDLKIVPDLHSKVWDTVKLISYNKQNVDLEKAKELLTKVNEIGDIFTKVKEERLKNG
ncbi:superoxide dismutase, Ni [Patescibacteria group bacterium]|nr:superoxide dismutase, Ni [Patescibacteria group bacterium]